MTKSLQIRRGILDEIMEWAEKLTPAELDEKLLARFHSNLLLLERLFAEGIEPVYRIVESDSINLEIANEIEALFAALERDGLLPAQTPGKSSFSLTTEAAITRTQASEEILAPEEWAETNYKKLLRGLCRTYETLYENLIAERLRPIAGFITQGKSPNRKALILKCIADYRSGEFKHLVGPFIPIIRNSIAHKDSIIDNKLPRVTFRDGKKATLTLSVDEFRSLCAHLLRWSVAFDYVLFKREEPMLRSLMHKMRKLQAFLEKSGVRLARGSPGRSLAELADSIPDVE